MENYKIQKKLGDGTYGSVYKATNLKTGEIVAIKKFKQKYQSWDECMQLREIKSLRKLIHPNIVKLKEVLKVHDEVNLVFEYLERNLLEVYMEYKKKNERIKEGIIKSIIKQVLEGLAYMHKHGYFHRDLKPENLLMYLDTVKICDFGLAREIRSRPPYTEYVATRWYRAPEILLQSANYNSPVDIFAVGCIMAELYMLAPLFVGNSNIDQLLKITQVLGNPIPQWPDSQRLAQQLGISFQNNNPMNLGTIITGCSIEGIQVINDMLKYDPYKRPSAQQLLAYPYFSESSPLSQPLYLPQVQQQKQQTKQSDDLEFSKDRFFKQEKRTQDKFKDSTQNFLDLLDQRIAEHDKEWGNPKKADKKKDSQNKFLLSLEKFQEPAIEENPRRNNPFKLLKYNDPIMNGQHISQSIPHTNHMMEGISGRQQKPVSMIHTNEFAQGNFLPIVGRSSILPKADAVPQYNYGNSNSRQANQKLPFYYQSKIHQNYGRIGDQILGINRNSKYDEFGFTKQAVQKFNY